MTTTPTSKPLRNRLAALGLLAGTIALAACSSGTTTKSTPTTSPPVASVGAVTTGAVGTATTAVPGKAATTPATAATGSTAVVANPPAAVGGAAIQVLPAKENPIKNTSTVQALKVESVHVEDNVDAAGKAINDHLEVALSNTGSTPLTAFEFYYTFTDPTTKVTESYYAKLPDSFTIPAGGKRVAHFDNTGAPDHFPVNKFSVYYTSKNALDGSVIVSATAAAAQTTTFKKAAGGTEAAD